MIPADPYDRSDWQLCLESGCPNLWTDGCRGPAICTKALARERGVQIYAALEGDDAQYVTVIAKRH